MDLQTLNLRRGSRIGILQCAMPTDIVITKLIRILNVHKTCLSCKVWYIRFGILPSGIGQLQSVCFHTKLQQTSDCCSNVVKGEHSQQVHCFKTLAARTTCLRLNYFHSTSHYYCYVLYSDSKCSVEKYMCVILCAELWTWTLHTKFNAVVNFHRRALRQLPHI